MQAGDNVTALCGPLSGLRVLECSEGIAGGYAGRLLADLGAFVIKVETDPSGDPLRWRVVPGTADEPPVRGALFAALNGDKRLFRLDPERAHDLELLDSLVVDADIVFVGAPVQPALDPDRLRARNPGLVVGISSPCRSLGDDACWLHVHAAALSSASAVVGDPGRAPLPPPFDIGEYETGVNLAAAVLAAHHRAVACGAGQVVRVDTAELLFTFMWGAGAISQQSAEPFTREGRRFPGSGGVYPFGIFRCKDGHIAVIARSEQNWEALVTIMGIPGWSREKQYADPVEIARQHADAADEHLVPWFAERTRAEVFALARVHKLPIAPLNSMADVLELEQFVARGAFGRPSTFGELGVRTVRQPYHFADTPMGGATPQVDDLAWQGPDGALRWPPDPRRASPDKTTGVPSGAIFEGLRVLDLGWIWSGPMVSAVLADLGADVIKIEHRGRLDNARLRKRPLVNGVPLAGPPHELSMVFHQHNRGKRSLTLDFKHPRGAQLLKELAARSDIVVENLTPGVFDRAGVGYRELSQVNPRLIWLAASSAGQDGPLAGMRAYAPIMTAMAGLEALVGYDDDPVVGMLGCGLGDPNAGSHGLLAVLAALRARELTGRGQYIDMSQIEAAAAVLVEPMVNAQLRGRQPAPWGFSHPDFAPHGHFRCLGHDQWVAVAAIDDAMWRRLADVVGISSTKAVLRHAGLEVRQRCREEIHRAIEEWTTPRDRDDVVGTLRRADVSAAPVLSLAEAMSTFDACLAHVRHPVTGEERIAPIAWDFSETPAIIQRPAPLVGEHNETILRGVLRYDGRSLEDLLDSPATT